MPLIIFKKKRIVEVLTSLFDVDLYREQTVLSIRGGKDGAYDKTFIDSSSLSNTITVSGDVRQGVIGPTPNSGSLYFDGSGDFIQWPNSAAQTIGAGDFTIEFWLKAAPTIDGFIIGARSAGGATFHITAGGYNGLTPAGSLRYGSKEQATTSIVFDNTWHHCAISRQSGTVRMFVDGRLERTFSDTSVVSSASGTYYIGCHDLLVGNSLLNGYLSNFRIVKEALYTENFTVPDAPLSAVPNTTLLLKAENTNVFKNNHSFVDSSSNALPVSRFGNVSQGSFSPFAETGGSAYFDGAGGYVALPSHADLALGAGDFTVEYWVNYSSFYNYITNICSTRGSNGFNAGSQAARQIVWYANGAERVRGVTTMSPNTWYHIAFVRHNGVLKGYVNGVQDGTTFADSINYSSPIQWVGTLNNLTEPFTGSMTGIRVSKGIARYTSNFTVPTSPLTSDANTSLLLKFENAGVTDATRNTNIRLFGNAALAANGKFGSSVYFPDTGDYASTINWMPAIGTSDFTIEGWLNPTSLPHTTYSASVIDTEVAVNDAGILIARRAAAGGNTNRLSVYQGGAWRLTSTSTIPLDQWTHFAVTRHAGTMSIYINGVREASVAHTASILVSPTTRIGNQLTNLAGSFRGYIDDLRITVGKARYQSNFVPMLSEFKDVKPTDFDPYWDKVVLRMTMDNFLTEVTGQSVSKTGNVFQSNDIKKYGTGSIQFGFDGRRTNIVQATGSVFNFGSDDLTIEMWYYPGGKNTQYPIVFSNYNLYGTGANIIAINDRHDVNPSKFTVFLNNGSSAAITSLVTPVDHTWYHLALSRKGSTWYFFVNGELQGTANVNFVARADSTFNIGNTLDGTQGRDVGLVGYIDDVRVTKGVARYTSNFVPPAAALPVSDAVVTDQDPYWNETVLAMPMNGIDNGTAFSDLKGNTINLYGNAVTRTSVKKFGTASAYFDGSTSGLVINNPNTAIGAITGDYTIECWVNWSTIPTGNSSGAEKQIIGQHNWPETTAGNWWALFGVNTGLQYYTAGGGSFQKLDGAFTWAQNTWYHVAVSRVGTTVRLFVNGELVGSGVSDKSIIVDNSRPLTIGCDMGGDQNRMHGYIDDLRITRGKARYTTNFTVPALPNPTTGPTF